jgi:hypothetical protein
MRVVRRHAPTTPVLLLLATLVLAGCGDRNSSSRASATPKHESTTPGRGAAAQGRKTATPAPGRGHGPWSAPVAAPPAPAPILAAPGWREGVTSAAGGARAIIEYTGSEAFRLRVAFRGRTRTLARYDRSDFLNPALTDVALAAAGDGSVLVVYSEGYAEGNRVRALTLAPNGRFGRARTIGRTLGFANVEAAVAPNGRAVVAWSTTDTGLEINLPARVLVTTRERGAAHFTGPRELDRARKVSDATPEPKLAVTSDDALLLWNATGRGLRAARGSLRDDVRLGAGRPGAVALRADGAALATWLRDGRVYAAMARPGGPFGRAEPVSDRTEAEDLDAAFDADGRPLVTWTADGKRLRVSRHG